MRSQMLVATVSVFAVLAAWSATQVEQSAEAITLRNERCAITLEVSKGGGVVTDLRLAGSDQRLVASGGLSLYFAEGQHWVGEAWISPSRVQVRPVADGQCVQVDVEDFGGFRLRKAVTLLDHAQVVQVTYELLAIRATDPELICPVLLQAPAELGILITPAGAIPRSDLQVSDFALELMADWYAFAVGPDGPGVCLVPVSWPDMHVVHYIGRHQSGDLSLATRLLPMKVFAPGETVRVSYNLIPFAGKATDAADLGREAGTGPIEPLASSSAATGSVDLGALQRCLRVATCPRLATSPKVDGNLTDACWDAAGSLGNFVNLTSTGLPDAQTEVLLGHDHQALYLAVVCHEPLMSQVRAEAQAGSRQVWTDDCIEVLLAAGEAPTPYAQFIVNPLGVTQEALSAGQPTSDTWGAATKCGEDRWCAELRIPFLLLGAEMPQSGAAWRLNVCRSRLPKQEWSAWSPTLREADFHVPERFGLLVFGAPGLTPTLVDTGLLGPGEERELRILLARQSGAQGEVDAEVQVTRDGHPLATHQARERIEIEVGQARWLSIPYQTPGPGTYRLRLQLAHTGTGMPILRIMLGGTVASAGLCSALYPPEADGNRLHLAKGTVQHFFFVPANHSSRFFRRFSFTLTLPEGVELLQATGDRLGSYHRPVLQAREPVEVEGHRMVRWVWESDRGLGPRELASVPFFETWCGAMIAQSDLEPGSYPFWFGLEGEGEREAEHRGELIVLPEPLGRQPRRLVVGMSCWTMSPSREFWTRLMGTYRRCGINLVDTDGIGGEFDAAASAAGMRRWKLLWWFWWNDAYLQEHPDHAAIRFDGQRDPKRICPEILASPDSDAIAGLMEPAVANRAAGGPEGYWWDLEGPACFEVCFCPRCLEAFRRYAGLSADEELTPLRIQARFDPEWENFACSQSARIAARMKAYAVAAGSDWKLAVYSGLQSAHTRRNYRVDWDLLTPHLDVATPSFYSFAASDLATMFTSGVTDCVRQIRAVRPIPVWTTLTTGYERGDGHFITDGRITRMQIIKSIAFGAQGTLQWWWGPVDGRHYQAYAQATSLLSDLEAFFDCGDPGEGGTMEPGFLNGDQAPGTSRVAWRRGDEVLVMLFNDSPFPLTATARVPAGWRLAQEDGRGKLQLQASALSAPVEPYDCRWAVLRPE